MGNEKVIVRLDTTGGSSTPALLSALKGLLTATECLGGYEDLLGEPEKAAIAAIAAATEEQLPPPVDAIPSELLIKALSVFPEVFGPSCGYGAIVSEQLDGTNDDHIAIMFRGEELRALLAYKGDRYNEGWRAALKWKRECEEDEEMTRMKE